MFACHVWRALATCSGVTALKLAQVRQQVLTAGQLPVVSSHGSFASTISMLVFLIHLWFSDYCSFVCYDKIPKLGYLQKKRACF